MEYSAYILGFGASLGDFVFNTFSSVDIDNNNLIGLEPVNFSNHIKKKRDLNNMSESQCLLVNVSGEAIKTSVFKDRPEMLAKANIYTVCSIGERDLKIDGNIRQAYEKNLSSLNNEVSRLRPTQLLMELPNLYSANIAIVLDLCGESLTFIGEHTASFQALTHAIEHTRTANISPLSLVGGVSNGCRAIIKESICNSMHSIGEGHKFAKASASILISTSEEHRDAAVAHVSYIGSIDEDLLKMQVKNPKYTSCLLATELKTPDDSSFDFITSDHGAKVVNITKRFGYFAEASLCFQLALALALLKRQPEGCFFVACQMLDGRYQTYEISK
jgi:hypothetical protein